VSKSVKASNDRDHLLQEMGSVRVNNTAKLRTPKATMMNNDDRTFIETRIVGLLTR
jgi:hypothetical protein